MAQEFNIGAMKAEAMSKAFGIDMEKGRTGVYEDNAENRRLNRVGQHYGHKKEEEASTGKQPGKSAQPTGQEQKTSAATMESAAQGASDEALKRALADKKAPEDVKAAAKKELANRGSDEEEGEKKSSLSNGSKSLKDFKKISSQQLWNMGYDSGDAKDIYMKQSGEGILDVLLVNEDGSVLHDHIDENVGEYEDAKEEIKEYKSLEEFTGESAAKEEEKIAESDLKALSEESDEADEMFEELFDYFHWEDDNISPENLKKFQNIEKHYNHKPGKQFDWKDEEYDGAATEYRKKMEEKGYIVVDFGHGTDTYSFELFKKKPERKRSEK